MECEETKIFERLIRIAKVLLPGLVIFSGVFYLFYRVSIDRLEITVLSKSTTWYESCNDYEFIELPKFTVKTSQESFVTSADLFHELQQDGDYVVEVKGWRMFGGVRNLVFIF